MQGLSKRNLQYMRAFAEAYPDEPFVQQAAAQLPWFHNCVVLDKLKVLSEREWYIQACIENGWSRPILEAQIETGLHERQGKAVHNFDRTLPAPQSELAAQMLKDPYIFDFLSLGQEAHERDLERGLLAHVKYVQLNFYRSTVKIKASYASMESVSHAEFWNSAAFATMPEGASYGQEGRMEEWSREILKAFLLELGAGFALVGSQQHLEVNGSDHAR